jgi:hypothetical protein
LRPSPVHGRKTSATKDDSVSRPFPSRGTRATQRKEENLIRQINGEAAREIRYAFEASGKQT